MQTSSKVALITGAGSGIGRACAIGLARANFTLILNGRRKETLEEVSKTILSEFPTAKTLMIPADVGNPDSVKTMFEQIVNEFGRLDLLFNNAGIFGKAIPLEDLSYEQWQSVVDTNLTGAFLCTQEAFKIMKAQDPMGGRIINNGSISASAPRPNSAPYTATKHAMTGLTKSTSLDGRKYNIACGQIDIGNAATNMTEKMTTGVPQADGTVKIEPTMDVSHVADAVVSMATLPLEANVQFMTIMATKMPLIGRG